MILRAGNNLCSDEDGVLWLSLNGELYGHREVRKQLMQRGHRLRSSCDAEIIPHLYQDHGAACFEQLRGEFAFAMVDQTRNELYLVRDRFGVKPLFYAFTGDSIVFGSELKSLFSHPDIEAELDRPYLRQSLMTLGVPDKSWFRGIRQVKPGYYLQCGKRQGRRVDRTGRCNSEMRHDRQCLKIEAEAADRFRTILDEAVRLRLDCDVEVGCYLSGGLDSSTIAESMARQAGYPIKTFSIKYSDAPDDESQYRPRVRRRAWCCKHSDRRFRQGPVGRA